MNEDPIEALRAALAVTPQNLLLRLLLAKTLRDQGRFADSELELKEALRRQPDARDAKVELARVFFRQSKLSESLVLLESLSSEDAMDADSLLLYARVLHARGDLEQANWQYRHALELDPAKKDSELEGALGFSEEPTWQESDERIREPIGGEIERAQKPDVEKPKINFSDVGGMEALKDEVRMKIILPLKDPKLFKAYGKEVGGGILMYGPPGCGKTHLARATAGEVEADFISVGIHDVLNMYIGESERQLHELFEVARDNKPCVLFFDEVDALASKRSDMRTSAGRHLINQFLAELDGTQHSNDGVLILGATNAPWHLDQAFRRPGRFDRVLFVPPPDLEGRTEILRLLGRGKPTEDIDYQHVAKKLKDFSGADLKGVFDLAIESKLAEAMKTGVPLPIRTKDLLAASSRVKPTTKEWFSTARNFALYSNEGGIYDDIKNYLKL